jgi:hypothetical protein
MSSSTDAQMIGTWRKPNLSAKPLRMRSPCAMTTTYCKTVLRFLEAVLCHGGREGKGKDIDNTGKYDSLVNSMDETHLELRFRFRHVPSVVLTSAQLAVNNVHCNRSRRHGWDIQIQHFPAIVTIYELLPQREFFNPGAVAYVHLHPASCIPFFGSLLCRHKPFSRRQIHLGR